MLMPKISPEAKAERRSQILEAAKICFARKGYEQASIDDVCECAGLSKGAVYLYFKSKDELIWAIIDSQADLLRGFTSDKGADEIIQAVQDLVGSGLQNTGGMRIEFYTILRAFSDPIVRDKYLANIEILRSALLNAVDHLASSGAATLTYEKDATVELLETLLLGLVMRSVFPEIAPRTNQLEMMFQMLLGRER